ncbi:MAG: hypothetical protein AAFV77_07110 [Planctomycetota bacterium]
MPRTGIFVEAEASVTEESKEGWDDAGVRGFTGRLNQGEFVLDADPSRLAELAGAEALRETIDELIEHPRPSTVASLAHVNNPPDPASLDL